MVGGTGEHSVYLLLVLDQKSSTGFLRGKRSTWTAACGKVVGGGCKTKPRKAGRFYTDRGEDKSKMREMGTNM